VLVTVEPPSTEKLAAVPKPTVAGAASALLVKSSPDSAPSSTSAARDVLRRVRVKAMRLAAREPPTGDSCVCGTPRVMGVS
jgi:hypothetical protein